MDFVFAVAPTVGVLVLFYVAIGLMFQADRRQGLAQAKWERAEAGGDRPGRASPDGANGDHGPESTDDARGHGGDPT